MKNCPICNAQNNDDSKFCGECGQNFTNPVVTTPSKYSGLGISSLVLGIIAICICWLPLLSYQMVIVFFFIILPLSVLSIVFGSVAYWGKWRDKLGLVGFIIGITSLAIGLISFLLRMFVWGYW